MSKELEALERINQKFVQKEWDNKPRETEKDFDIIEAALKRLERIDNTKLIIIGNPSPNKSAADKLINERMFVGAQQEMEIKSLHYEDVDKKLKAFEIIKEKRVDVELLMKTNNAKHYNMFSKNTNPSHNLGQRQYDFLKEVLL